MYEEKPTKRALEHISGSGDSRECSIYLPLWLLIQFSCNFVNFSDGPVCWYSWQQRRGVPGFLRITSRQDIQIYTRHVSSWPPHTIIAWQLQVIGTNLKFTNTIQIDKKKVCFNEITIFTNQNFRLNFLIFLGVYFHLQSSFILKGFFNFNQKFIVLIYVLRNSSLTPSPNWLSPVFGSGGIWVDGRGRGCLRHRSCPLQPELPCRKRVRKSGRKKEG